MLLLGLLYPEEDGDRLWDLPIGERDLALLHLRTLLFGEQMRSAAHCPHCGEHVEWEAKTTDLMFQELATLGQPKHFSLPVGATDTRFRLPTSRDIVHMANQNPEQRDLAFIATCAVDDIDLTQLSQAQKVAINKEMAALNPQADIQLAMVCPACGHQWSLTFDIMTYLWDEVNEWGMKMIQEVALLAKHFSWSETAILEMDRFRRDRYLETLLS